MKHTPEIRVIADGHFIACGIAFVNGTGKNIEQGTPLVEDGDAIRPFKDGDKVEKTPMVGVMLRLTGPGKPGFCYQYTVMPTVEIRDLPAFTRGKYTV